MKGIAAMVEKVFQGSMCTRQAATCSMSFGLQHICGMDIMAMQGQALAELVLLPMPIIGWCDNLAVR